jgi:hypothetical protein
MNSSAIALFAYNRPNHLRQTMDALLRNPEAGKSTLYVFSDGAKSIDDTQAVNAIRLYVSDLSGFAGVHLIQRGTNFGLARNIIEGVTHICDQHDRVIVLEDDLITSPHFLRYMNEALSMYELDDRVISIHGYGLPTRGPMPESFFLRGADCWGWATWRRGWALFEPNGSLLLRELRTRKLTAQFDLDGTYPYTRMLEAQVAGKNDSWAIRWHASAFLQDRLSLHPGRSLVANIGNDGSGTHCSTTNRFVTQLATTPIEIARQPLEEHRLARQMIKTFLVESRPSLLTRALQEVKKIVRP